jgi:hypothetical protein
MTTKTLNKRLDRLQAPNDWRHGIADIPNEALAKRRARREELSSLGLTEAEIEAREAAALRDLLARVRPDSLMGKRIW